MLKGKQTMVPVAGTKFVYNYFCIDFRCIKQNDNGQRHQQLFQMKTSVVDVLHHFNRSAAEDMVKL